MKKRLIYIVFLLIPFTLLSANVGNITAIRGEVKIINPKAEKLAHLGDELENDDSVVTGNNAKAPIIFQNETIVTIGKNSNFSIKEYLFDDKDVNVKFGLIKGAIKTITGKIGKIAPQKFSVETKTATIGIRGTNFTITALESGEVNAYCTYGAISVTINKQDYIVDQGFFLHTVNGAVELKAFSAKDLKEVRNKTFGKNKALSKATIKQKNEVLDKTVVLDTTKDSLADVIVQEVDEATSDVVQQENTVKFEDYIVENEKIEPEPEIITEVVEVLPVIEEVVIPTISLLGYSMSYDTAGIFEEGDSSSLSFLSDGSSFNSESSYVSVKNMPNGLESSELDNWQFFTASTPSSFTSSEEFSIDITSVALDPQGDSTSRDPILNSGSIEATDDDLASGDYMSWGTWNVNVSYVTDADADAKHDLKGFWVSGDVTPVDIIDALRESGDSYSYSGIYKALNLSTGNDTTGDATLDVDFGNDTARVTIYNLETSDDSYFVDMTVSENSLLNSESSDDDGLANGKFYGPNAENSGGTFLIHGSNDDYTGAYEVEISQ